MKKKAKAKKKATILNKKGLSFAKRSVKKRTAAKKPKMTKAQEEAHFRAEVQRYLATGQSAILTLTEKASLDKTREKKGWFASLMRDLGLSK